MFKNYKCANIAYLEYIYDHMKNVKVVWARIKRLLLKYPLEEIDKVSIVKTDVLINKHDYSKFQALEFEAYRNKFFPCVGEDKKVDFFEKAWNHHQKSNPHHWEYWCLIEDKEIKALDIPLEYILEMLCDWTAMSMKFKDTPSIFYNNNKYKMVLSNNTQKLIETFLPLFDMALKLEEDEND